MARSIHYYPFLFFGLFLIFFNHNVIKCGSYKIEQIGDLSVVDEFNTLANAKIIKHDKGFNMELENMIRFPVYCIPFSTVDKNASTLKKPIYFIKQEFENSLYLYKNNIPLMPIDFMDKKYIADIAANNGVLLMITDIHFYLIKTTEKKIVRLTLWNRKHFNVSEIKNIFFSTLVSGINHNEFFATAIKTHKSFILHLKYHEDGQNAEIVNIIESANHKSLRVVNGVTVTKSGLYISENSENIIKYKINEDHEVSEGEIIHVMKKHDIITLHGKTIYDKQKNRYYDLLLVNSKVSEKLLPSSNNLVYLLKIEEIEEGEEGEKSVAKETDTENEVYKNSDKKKKLSIREYKIVDLFNKDKNLIYFNIYDVYFSFDEIADEQHMKTVDKIVNSLKPNTKKLLKNKEMKKNNFFSENAIKILWTNTYSCSINKGLVSLDKMAKIDYNYENNMQNATNILPFDDVRSFISLTPSVSAVTHCTLKKKVFNALCYYSADENSVSYLSHVLLYNSDFKSNFYFDGYKNYIAFDYKSYKQIHILTYPYNNIIFVFAKDVNLKISMPSPFGISIDTERSYDTEATFYVASNDENYNYINKCVVDLSKKDYECHESYRRKKSGFELFYYISYISYTLETNKSYGIVYITNNAGSVYALSKIDDKRWNFQLYFQLENPEERIGAIATSICYFFVNKKALERLLKKYPDSPMLQKARSQFALDNGEKNKISAKVNKDSDGSEDSFSFLLQSHTFIYSVNKGAYGYNTGTSLHFYSVILKETYYVAFPYNGVIQNISNEATFNYYLLE